MNHVFYKCPDPCPNPGACKYCDGGLAFCTVCRKGEAELAATCPGPPTLPRMNPRPGEMPSHFYCTCGCRQGWLPWKFDFTPDTITQGHPPQVIPAYRWSLWAYPRICGRPVIGGYTCTQTRGHEPPCSHTVAVYTRAYAPDYKHDPTKVAASGASGFNVERAELPLCECESGRECGAGMQVGRRCALGRAALPVSPKQYPCFCIGRACKMPSETLPYNQYCKKLRR